MNKEYDVDGEFKETGLFNFVKNNPTYNFDYIANAYCQLFTHLLKELVEENKSDELKVEYGQDGKNNTMQILSDNLPTVHIHYNIIENDKVHFQCTEDLVTEMNLSTLRLSDYATQFLLQCATDTINFHIPHFDVDKLIHYTVKIFDTLGLGQYFKDSSESLTVEDQIAKFFHRNELTLKHLTAHYQTLVALTFPTPATKGTLVFDANYIHFDWDTLLIEPSKKSKHFPLTVKTITHVHYIGDEKVSDVLVLEDDILRHYLIRNNQLEIADSELHGKNVVDWSEEIGREPYFHLLREKYTQYISDLEYNLEPGENR